MAKKTSRKKSKKPQKPKKPKKPVRKKPRKSVRKSSGGGSAAASADVRLKYKCSGSGTCSVTPRFAHMSPGDNVALEAVNTDVTITFQNGSPFDPPTNTLHLSEGETVMKVVAGDAFGHFEYDLRCSECALQPQLPPEMIVP